MDYSLTGSSVHGILQARILEWVAMPSSRGSSQPRDQISVSCVSYTPSMKGRVAHDLEAAAPHLQLAPWCLLCSSELSVHSVAVV